MGGKGIGRLGDGEYELRPAALAQGTGLVAEQIVDHAAEPVQLAHHRDVPRQAPAPIRRIVGACPARLIERPLHCRSDTAVPILRIVRQCWGGCPL